MAGQTKVKYTLNSDSAEFHIYVLGIKLCASIVVGHNTGLAHPSICLSIEKVENSRCIKTNTDVNVPRAGVRGLCLF